MEDLMLNLQALRALKDMTQEQLGTQLGVTKETIRSWEKGHTSPNMAQMKKISELFNVPIGNIFLPDTPTTLK